ncbi:hypothetical protein FP568_15300 [Pandoraea pnomenusa]|uniref:hypothetical protein n=1 Tax=Pandoraea pnomenusa TaxID=93220 RepID=UPI001198395F|nr:hypothetical protein [Pandoraea pnomenusa]QDX22486.1 hypothetical protein FP568_15300 [Pandoraea pnomenusa]
MSFLDLSYDHLFEARKSLPWWPWVGSQYAASAIKTMIVGESVYEWEDKDREIFQKRYARTTGLRETHERHALSFSRNSPYVRNIERAIFAASKPKDEQKRSLWTSVAYHNLVLEPLRDIEHRPSQGQFCKGWVEVLDLCGLLSVEQLLVYGVGSVGALQEVARSKSLSCRIEKGQKVGRCAARRGLIDTGDSQIKLLFIRHPSEFFSWKRWGRVIHENLAVPFGDHGGGASLKG